MSERACPGEGRAWGGQLECERVERLVPGPWAGHTRGACPWTKFAGRGIKTLGGRVNLGGKAAQKIWDC